VVGELFRPQWRGVDILALARNLRSVGVVVNHVALATAAGGIDFLLDCWGDEITGGSGGLRAGDTGDVAYAMIRVEARC
jgi:hypothetical protein